MTTMSDSILVVYDEVPDCQVPLDIMHDLALTRFKSLSATMLAYKRNRFDRFSPKWSDFHKSTKQAFDTACTQKWCKDNISDLVSHFTVRLACHCNKDRSKWFTEAERIWFELKAATASWSVLKRTMYHLLTTINMLSDQEDHWTQCVQLHFKDDLFLLGVNGKSPIVRFDTLHQSRDDVLLPYCVVPVEGALNMISKREVLLSKGMVYIPKSRLHIWISYLYMTTLQSVMGKADEKLSKRAVSEDERWLLFDSEHRKVGRILKQVCMCIDQELRYQRGIQSDVLGKTDLKLMLKGFPLCMLILWKERTVRRLKYLERGQLILFLKQSGLPLSVALTLLPKRDEYDIKHWYGTVGSHKHYYGYGCQALIKKKSCPFISWSTAHLQSFVDTEIGQINSIYITAGEPIKSCQALCKQVADIEDIGDKNYAWCPSSYLNTVSRSILS